MFPGEKDCTLALNFGGGAETEDNVPARFEYIRLRALQVKFLVLPSCRVFEQPLLLQPDPNTLILEGHIHANPKPKVGPSTYSSSNSGRTLSRSQRLFFYRSRSRQFIIPPLVHTLLDQVTWLCNGDFVKESERKMSKLEPMEGANKWRASLVITVCVFGLALKLGQEDG